MLDKIKQLRELTGVSIAECQKAIKESGGDIEKACFILKKASLAAADKRSERKAGSGIIESYIHMNGRIGVLVELRCETDFVARNEDFKELAHNLAMQIAALNPLFVSKDNVPSEKKSEIEEAFLKDIEGLNKSKEIAEKIVKGKVDAILKEQVLLEQPFIKDQNMTVSDFLKEAIQKFGENIKIARFIRFEV